MKIKKSAASAALKPSETKITSGAPKAASVAKKSAPVAAKVTPPAPKPVSEAPTTIPAAPLMASETPKPVVEAPKAPSGALTTIEVKLDVGLGNAIFLRGQGSGLTWEQGVPLACVDGGTWVWSQTVASPITFKVLLNDTVWSAGNDLVVTPGQKLEISPSFA